MKANELDRRGKYVGRAAQYTEPTNFHTGLLAVRPRLTTPLYTHPPAISVVLASVSFLLAVFAEHLGTQNAGEEDVDQFEFELSGAGIAVSTFICPRRTVLLVEKSELKLLPELDQ